MITGSLLPEKTNRFQTLSVCLIVAKIPIIGVSLVSEYIFA